MDKNNVEYRCPICNKQFKSKAILKQHYLKKDKAHQQYHDEIINMQHLYEQIQDLNIFKCGDNCCSQCNKNCFRQEKFAYDKYKRIDNKEKKKQEQQQIQEKREYIKKTAAKLVKEFYALCHLSYENYVFDLVKIKNLLRLDYTEEEIRNAFGYMYNTGKFKLSYMQEYTIKDGRDWKNFQLQLRNPQSIPSLITKYYKNLNIKVANSLIFKNTQDFWSLQNEYNLNQEQIEYIFNYMIKKHIPVFNYIKSQIPLILQEFNKNSIYIIDIQKYNSNNYYFDSAINELQEGSETLDNIINIYGQNDLFQKKILTFLKNRSYNNNLSPIEWLYKINAPVTKEMYFLAKQIVQEQKCSLYHFNNNIEINNFKQWLKNYKNIYES